MTRADYFAQAPQAFQLLMQQETLLVEAFTQSPVLSIEVLELVKLRISQINQCAFCIDMHSYEAQQKGESVERLLGLNAWRDMPHYTQIERAALTWCEQIASAQNVEDSVYEQACHHLGEQALVLLTVATNAISAWNRIAKTFQPEVGSYRR